MTNNIKNKKLWRCLDKIKKQEDWLSCAEKLDLRVGTGKGSHFTIRDPKKTDDDSTGLIATIPCKLYKEFNQHIFKKILNFGLEENII